MVSDMAAHRRERYLSRVHWPYACRDLVHAGRPTAKHMTRRLRKFLSDYLASRHMTPAKREEIMYMRGCL